MTEFQPNAFEIMRPAYVVLANPMLTYPQLYLDHLVVLFSKRCFVQLL